ncbi:hypothetical protein LPJ53_005101 [Coemansia erecta]|uniref:NAD(P)-binding protein n=1 Tax=Coemansia erecta TaxID=147472 RepID=A0A9W8CNI3_9FUNG|nr:hypothetical protein LPJ53_005101 [Coemansia erecta]
MAILQSAFTYIGIAVVAYYASLVLTFLYDIFVRSGVKLSKFGAGQGYWAVVTGCTDGLGREAALELARKKFNVVLISRSATKLASVAAEIEALGVESKTVVVDFASTTAATWEEIGNVVNSVRVGVLINNVGISYDYPMYVEEASEETVDGLVDINMRSMIKMTRLVLPQMKERKQGLILNSGSFAALLPSPFLAMYSGSKGFVKYFTQSLASEVQRDGIVVEHLQTYFVCSNMSKTRKATFMIPMPKPYIRQVFAKIGVQGGSSEPFTSVPYFSHGILAFVAEHLVPKQTALDYNYKLLSGLRKRALKKMQALKDGAGDKAKAKAN